MNFLRLAIPDVILVEPQVFGDDRGYFMETWQAAKFAAAGIDASFVQDNHSRSCRGTLRGLHYQLVRPQGKLVRVIAGEVFDVAVDLRRGSPTFGHWVGETLSVANKRQVWLPPGFAHGFYVISEFAEFTYKCTDYYHPQSERSLLWSDPALAISWPVPSGSEPILSAKDRAGVPLQSAECYE
ncbi:MAG: dTDP-4-dehydrorhamnose 3,5-epimerase [Gammaproteobacteria bacterium]|nr:MAG: dTDP-4-dehydrorhamnose 3,5-epimerase [Gammaproteobacteria bacterium]